jgi:hypothetical protein
VTHILLVIEILNRYNLDSSHPKYRKVHRKGNAIARWAEWFRGPDLWCGAHTTAEEFSSAVVVNNAGERRQIYKQWYECGEKT